jgi:hypothetical protein
MHDCHIENECKNLLVCSMYSLAGIEKDKFKEFVNKV